VAHSLPVHRADVARAALPAPPHVGREVWVYDGGNPHARPSGGLVGAAAHGRGSL